MKMTIDMPVVAECEISDCAYNQKLACHARAITIGNGVTPGCDTYFPSSTHAKNVETIAGVGACKVNGCMHNADLECTAQRIHVGFAGSRVDCLTYSLR